MDAALLTAVRRNNPAAVEQRLAAGVSPAAVDHKGWSALHFAVFNGNAAVARVLLRHGAPVDARTDVGSTPLLWANRVECCRLLLLAGADVHAVNSYGESPLHYAVWRNYQKVVALLLAAGADPRVRNGDGQTPADNARSFNRQALVALLQDAASAFAR